MDVYQCLISNCGLASFGRGNQDVMDPECLMTVFFGSLLSEFVKRSEKTGQCFNLSDKRIPSYFQVPKLTEVY